MPVRRPAREPVVAKIPEVTAVLWLVTLLTTATGAAASDHLLRVGVGLT